MIDITTLDVSGFKGAFLGMRNPYKSRSKSDSLFFEYDYPIIGQEDLKLAKTLAWSAKGSDKKFLRMLHVQADIDAPLYWWKEMDQYKVATTTDSESTMHTIEKSEFDLSDFSQENLFEGATVWIEGRQESRFKSAKEIFEEIIQFLNGARKKYLDSGKKDKLWWWQMIQLLPSSYNQMRTWDGDYQTLQAIYHDREGHKLTEWTDFRKWIETLPYSELITGKKESK